MQATITKIHQPKQSRNGNIFIRVEFKLDTGKWAKTDICPDFRNYKRWEDKLQVGNILEGIRLKSRLAVDADSPVEFYHPTVAGEYRELPNGNMQFVERDDSFVDSINDQLKSMPDCKLKQTSFI